MHARFILETLFKLYIAIAKSYPHGLGQAFITPHVWLPWPAIVLTRTYTIPGSAKTMVRFLLFNNNAVCQVCSQKRVMTNQPQESLFTVPKGKSKIAAAARHQ